MVEEVGTEAVADLVVSDMAGVEVEEEDEGD